MIVPEYKSKLKYKPVAEVVTRYFCISRCEIIEANRTALSVMMHFEVTTAVNGFGDSEVCNREQTM